MIKKSLDERVAGLLGMRTTDVALVTSVFLRELVRELVRGSAVQLDSLFTLTPRHQEGGIDQRLKLHVYVKKGRFFLDELRRTYVRQSTSPMPLSGLAAGEETMEKYGVDENKKNFEKYAQEGCPDCGCKVEKHGDTLVCPKCGTAPFEDGKK